MASSATAQMAGAPGFMGAFGMGGGFEPPALYAFTYYFKRMQFVKK
jgi:hypothetical protein